MFKSIDRYASIIVYTNKLCILDVLPEKGLPNLSREMVSQDLTCYIFTLCEGSMILPTEPQLSNHMQHTNNHQVIMYQDYPPASWKSKHAVHSINESCHHW